MPEYDLSGEQLLTYRPASTEPADLREFWTETLAESRTVAFPPKIRRVENGLGLVETYDIVYSGFAGDPVHAWYHRPAGVSDPLPVIVTYPGYGGGRGLSHQVRPWVLSGHAALDVDNRGQGSVWQTADTADPHGSGAAHPGFMTRGVLDPHDYYFRRVYTDGILALDAIASLPGADPEHMVIGGTSQGGGVAVAVAALAAWETVPVRGVTANVPFLADFPRAIRVAPQPPYTELAGYLAAHRDHVSRVLTTLAYFDLTNLAPYATAPALFSVALMDRICPPSTVYAAYNAYGGPKSIVSYPFNDHEGGQMFQEAEQLAWLKHMFRSD